MKTKKAITFTINVGNGACKNDCHMCVSQMTGKHFGTGNGVDWKAFDHAVQVAINYGCENVLLTSKGEPLMYPDLIKKYLVRLKKYRQYFTRIELQTSGDTWMSEIETIKHYKEWKKLGLYLVALSAYHPDDKKNDALFIPSGSYKRASLLRKSMDVAAAGLKLRVSFVLMKGYIEHPGDVLFALNKADEMHAFQTTFREIGMPSNHADNYFSERAVAFVKEHAMAEESSHVIKTWFNENGHACDVLPFGGTIYEMNGMNVCLTTCLDQCKGIDELRNLIFFQDGTLATSWEHVRGTAIL